MQNPAISQMLSPKQILWSHDQLEKHCEELKEIRHANLFEVVKNCLIHISTDNLFLYIIILKNMMTKHHMLAITNIRYKIFLPCGGVLSHCKDGEILSNHCVFSSITSSNILCAVNWVSTKSFLGRQCHCYILYGWLHRDFIQDHPFISNL